ncbi:MAG: hypothetical protein QOF90_2620, partial [Acetobacteraceae bacterium]|nr:hypothetical protein [Acetobacteraceae bacterium]
MVNALKRFAPDWEKGCRIGAASAIVIMLAAVSALPCRSAGIIATVTDEHGQPLPDAVVSVISNGKVQIAPSDRLATATIDQHEETFVPTVVVVQRGGSVIFHNSDHTRHHIYSFSQ